MKLDVVYKIEKNDSWRDSDGIKIESNIAGDDLVECHIAKSLVEYLKKESAILNPDKLLLGFAEAQKRGIEENLEALNDIELRAKNTADTIQEKLLKSYEDAEEKYAELEKRFDETHRKFSEGISKTRESVESEIEQVESISDKLNKIDNYSLERLSETLKQLLALVEKDSELVKMVLEYKKPV